MRNCIKETGISRGALSPRIHILNGMVRWIECGNCSAVYKHIHKYDDIT